MACNKYQDGLIYTIKTDDGLYVGSTIDFANRKRGHKCYCFNENSRKYNYELYKNIRKNGGEYSIEIYKLFPCNSDEELRMEEEEVRKFLNANLNTNKAFRTIEEIKEYNKLRESKRERQYGYNKEAMKRYYEKNKEQMNEKRKEKTVCECGIQITKRNITRHMTSPKHLNLMELKRLKVSSSEQEPS